MADVEAGVAEKTAPESKPALRKAGPAVAFIVLLVIAGGFVWRRPAGAPAAVNVPAESTLALETFVVNLSGSSQRAYLRVGITLGLAHPTPKSNPAEAVPTALIRDTILSVLGTANPEELLKTEGKRRLKDELLKTLQERVPQMAIENVYFTEFLVQM